jgi:hypothetical protein
MGEGPVVGLAAGHERAGDLRHIEAAPAAQRHERVGLLAIEGGRGSRSLLDAFLGGRGIAYNVYVSHQNEGGTWVNERMLYRGRPSDNAISASRKVTLYDGDCLVDGNNETNTTRCLSDSGVADAFYADDVSSTGLYNVVRVEVVVWRM